MLFSSKCKRFLFVDFQQNVNVFFFKKILSKKGNKGFCPTHHVYRFLGRFFIYPTHFSLLCFDFHFSNFLLNLLFIVYFVFFYSCQYNLYLFLFFIFMLLFYPMFDLFCFLLVIFALCLYPLIRVYLNYVVQGVPFVHLR